MYVSTSIINYRGFLLCTSVITHCLTVEIHDLMVIEVVYVTIPVTLLRVPLY